MASGRRNVSTRDTERLVAIANLTVPPTATDGGAISAAAPTGAAFLVVGEIALERMSLTAANCFAASVALAIFSSWTGCGTPAEPPAPKPRLLNRDTSTVLTRYTRLITLR